MGLHWLDFKLGIRMLLRYPMLTIVGGLAMAVAIGVGAGTFEILNRITNPTLPLSEGERIVGLSYWDRAASDQRRATPSEFLEWREGLRTIEDFGAFRIVQRNLSVGDDVGEPTQAAEISAAAFRLTRVPPLLGRTLVEADEDARAPAVAVIGLEAGLRAASAGAGGLRMGGIWTAVIVAQIAMTVVFTAVAYITQRQATGLASARAAFPAENYLAVRIEMDDRQRYAATIRELEQRIAAHTRVAGVTLAERFPMMGHDGGMIELDDAAPEDASRRREHFVTRTAVDRDFFDVLQAHVLAGRSVASLDASAHTVVVNQLFVQEILAGRNALGRRIRYTNEDGATEPGPWFEIVGVIRDLVTPPSAPLSVDNPAKPLVYHALSSTTYPLYMALHVRGEPKAMVPTLRRMAVELSPALRLTDIQRLDEAKGSDARTWSALAKGIFVVSAIALVLSLAGIYAVMSFAASRRTREIAVRVALGAPASSVLANVFRKPVGQVAAGIATGCLLVGSLIALSLRDSDVAAGTVIGHASLLLAYGAAMMTVCAAACIGPVRRVLRVDPIDALRDDG